MIGSGRRVRAERAAFAALLGFAAAVAPAGCRSDRRTPRAAAPASEAVSAAAPPAPATSAPGAAAPPEPPEAPKPNSASAAPPPPPLPRGAPLLGDLSTIAFRAASPDAAEFALTPVSGRPYDRVARLRTARRPPRPWDIELKMRSVGAIREGDTILLRFDLRGAELQAAAYLAAAGVGWQSDAPPHDKALWRTVSVDDAWRTFVLAFRAPRNYAAGEAAFVLTAGTDPQTLELGGVEAFNLGPGADPAALPTTRSTYRGREADAPWRREAEQRIRAHRMADLEVRVTDAAGRPVSGASVEARMTRNAYRFGSALNDGLWLGKESPDRERYRAEFFRLFEAAVFEGGMKWPAWADAVRRERTLQVVGELERRKMPIRGHCLVWPGWKWLPANLRAMEGDPPRLRAAVLDHIRDIGGALRGRVIEWDVLNEPFHNRALMNVLGDGAMVEWFHAARRADPGARLFINENAILNRRANAAEKTEHYETTIAFLLDRGAPLDAIGLQGHCYDPLTPPEAVLAQLDRFARFRRPIAVTECDILVEDEELQGDYFRDFLIAVFSHPATDGFYIWGFWDGAHWKRNAPIFRQDWSLKPAGRAWEELVLNAWRSRETGVTDADGRFRARVFRGDYEIAVRADGREARAAGRVGAEGGAAHVRMP